jgi:hypothetical protein
MEIQRRYQVFVSSTYEDLRLERAQVSQAVLELGHFPAGMELFPASDETQWEVIKKAIDESDYYIVVVAGRYGSTDKEGLSFTEKEFDYASSKGVPVLGFLCKDISSLPNKYCDTNSKAVRALEVFREKVKSKMCRFYGTPEELGLVVSKSLIHAISTNPRVGWVRADQAKNASDFELVESLRKHIQELEEENDGLSEHVRNSVLPISEVGEAELQDDDEEFLLTISYKRDKVPVSEQVALSWKAILEALGPGMFGFLLPRNANSYGLDYFGERLVDLVRTKYSSKVRGLSLKLQQTEIDTVIFQLKQLGYIQLQTNDDKFRGWTLTRKGQAKLTRLKVQTKKQST